MVDEPNIEQRQDDTEYEAPKVEVLGTVRQLTSEGDTTEVPK